MGRSSRQKINKETLDLNDALDQMGLDIYRTFHPIAAEYKFLSSTRRTFPKTDYTLDHKISLNKFEKSEIISSIFCDHNCMNLEINYKKKTKGVPGWLS